MCYQFKLQTVFGFVVVVPHIVWGVLVFVVETLYFAVVKLHF